MKYEDTQIISRKKRQLNKLIIGRAHLEDAANMCNTGALLALEGSIDEILDDLDNLIEHQEDELEVVIESFSKGK